MNRVPIPRFLSCLRSLAIVGSLVSRAMHLTKAGVSRELFMSFITRFQLNYALKPLRTLGLGGWFGALINGYLCDMISRRWTLLVGALICCLGTGLTAGAQGPEWMVSRVFFFVWVLPPDSCNTFSLSDVSSLVGLSVRSQRLSHCTIHNIVNLHLLMLINIRYNSEIAPPELRGTIVSIQQLAIVSGICISFWCVPTAFPDG